MAKQNKNPKKGDNKEEDLPGYPEYPNEDDIYNREKESPIENSDDPKTRRVKGEETSMEDNMDVPGGELDDENEDIGEEDEENNYYSLGGDRHEDPEPGQ